VFIMPTILPSIMLVVLVTLLFWLPGNLLAPKVQVCTIVLLVSSSLRLHAVSSLPVDAGITWMDRWLLFQMFFVALLFTNFALNWDSWIAHNIVSVRVAWKVLFEVRLMGRALTPSGHMVAVLCKDVPHTKPSHQHWSLRRRFTARREPSLSATPPPSPPSPSTLPAIGEQQLVFDEQQLASSEPMASKAGEPELSAAPAAAGPAVTGSTDAGFAEDEPPTALVSRFSSVRFSSTKSQLLSNKIEARKKKQAIKKAHLTMIGKLLARSVLGKEYETLQVEFSDLIDVAMPSEETIDVFSWLGFSFIYFTTIAVMLGRVQWS